jgi:hypothetical protein
MVACGPVAQGDGGSFVVAFGRASNVGCMTRSGSADDARQRVC